MLNLFFGKHYFYLCGNEPVKDYHRHYPYQLIFCPEEKMKMFVPGCSTSESHSFLVDSYEHHYCIGSSATFSFFIEPGCREGVYIKRNYIDKDKRVLDGMLSDRFLTAVASLLDGASDSFDEVHFILQDDLLSELWRIEPHIDPRILFLFDKISLLAPCKTNIPDLASLVNLSESRLMSLFKANTGTSVMQYVIWQRLLKAVKNISEGKDFSFAAHESGFSDYPHFSRTFRETFGISPKDVLKNNRILQVSFD